MWFNQLMLTFRLSTSPCLRISFFSTIGCHWGNVSCCCFNRISNCWSLTGIWTTLLLVGANTGAGELDAVDAGDDDDETVETVAADGTVTGIVLPGADVLDDDEDSDGDFAPLSEIWLTMTFSSLSWRPRSRLSCWPPRPGSTPSNSGEWLLDTSSSEST